MKLYILWIHVYIADTGLRQKHQMFFPSLVWSPPFYSKSRPSHIFIVSHGSHVSQICRSKMGSLRCNWYCNWYRESRNLWIWIFGDLEFLASGYCPKTVLFLFCLISGLRNVLDFFSFMFELQPFGTSVFVSLVFGNPKAEFEKVWRGWSLSKCANLNHWVLRSMNAWVPECLNPWVLESFSPWVLEPLNPGDFESLAQGVATWGCEEIGHVAYMCIAKAPLYS